MTARDYRDKVVIVTGASSGIGRVTAKAFAQRGGVVVAVARREELLRQLVRECQVVSPASHYLAGDLGERAFAEHISPQPGHHGHLRTQFGRHDRLVRAFPAVAHVEGMANDRFAQAG